MGSQSCWEWMYCGAERGCPAYPNHGRDCWEVDGTLCRGEKQGAAQEKGQDCITLCKFMEGVFGGKI
jgi:methyl-accepting chemotaxis protein